ncbi:CAAX geranylgeranyltransferase alpha subunit [Friedmanniomyces endolithicus]|nr:CAAX geranylgeranyltransferase alpha subunit [Friedmanniomyces endolithicus]KAK0297153.1 CAAX geranylgeranyltransferase alpha subunit [Friedmanniomyces endolithicus]KAK1012720.1 CAAX geranylgeranyltransferase alpha subunit [Friedmanniomyces endolithicus]
MGKYASDPAWSDIIPLPTDEGGTHPLAQIAYSADYAETMSYLRALMAANEFSPRALDLTEDLIDMNPAHYTVWLYRAQCLFALDSDLREELEWLSETALAHQKNYQIWHHRNLVVDRLGSCEGETGFVERMFERDAKNYHVWCYRQWLVRRFGLWEEGELEFTERMLGEDVRNNSAWNHRWFVVNGREGKGRGVEDPEIRAREVRFAEEAIGKVAQNQSPWNYLRGIMRRSGRPLAELRGIAEQYASLERPDAVRSSFALDLLADILAEEEDGKEKAGRALDLLASRYDPIRKNYWAYRKHQLGMGELKSAVPVVA